MHDPDVYPQPEAFQPERFLKDGKHDVDARDPHVAAFGFGRRFVPSFCGMPQTRSHTWQDMSRPAFQRQFTIHRRVMCFGSL